jgi:hypothetical protein
LQRLYSEFFARQVGILGRYRVEFALVSDERSLRVVLHVNGGVFAGGKGNPARSIWQLAAWERSEPLAQTTIEPRQRRGRVERLQWRNLKKHRHCSLAKNWRCCRSRSQK